MTTFERDGYELLEEGLDEGACEAACARVERCVAEAARDAGERASFWPRFAASASAATVLFQDGAGPPSAATAIRYGHGLHHADPVFAALCASAPVQRALERALGPGFRLLQAAVVRKPPGLTEAQFGWHQDAWYLPARPDETALAFVALDAMTPANGCLEVIPGSHHGPRAHTLRLGARGFEPVSGRDPGPVDARRAEVLAMRRGAIAVVHGRTFHASGPNRTDAPRRSLIVHAIAASARLEPTAWLRASGVG